MNVSEFGTQAAGVHAQLKTAAQTLRQQFEAERGWTMPDSVEGAISSALKTIDVAIDKLSPGGTITARVLSGEKTAAWWDDAAAVPRESLAYVARTMGESLPSWQRIKGEIIDPTAAEFVADAQSLTEAAASLLPWWTPWAVGGGLALGLVVLVGVYLPKPSGG